MIEEVAHHADATLVLEPSAHGAVKTARKGNGTFRVTASGVEAHAGLAPQDGASAITALSEFVVAAAAVAAPDKGTTINPGLITGGSGANVVAGMATASVNIRVSNEGLPVLCGMGAVGDGAHAQGEFIYPDTVPTQTALVAGLLGRLAEPLHG